MAAAAAGVGALEAVVVANTLLLVVLYLVSFTRTIGSQISRLWETLKAWPRSFVLFVRRRRKAAEADPISQYIAKQVALRQVRNLRTALALCSFAGLVLQLSVVYAVLARRSRWMTAGQDCSLMAFSSLTTLLRVRPSLVSPRTVSLWFSAVTLTIISWLLFVTARPGNLAVILMSFAFRLLLSLACLRLSVVVLFNVAYTCANLRAGLTALAAVNSFDAVEEMFVFIEFCSLLLVIACVWRASRSIWEEIRQGVATSALLNQGAAMRKMLDLICDVVVELDAELQTADEEPKFAAMLMLAPGRVTQGMRLQQFMPLEEDAQRFEATLLSAAAQVSSYGCGSDEAVLEPRLGAFQTEIRDSNGSRLSVDLFHVRFESPVGEARFLVGIRETADQQLAELPTFERPEQRPQGRRRRNRHRGGNAGVDSPLGGCGGGGGGGAGAEASSSPSSSPRGSDASEEESPPPCLTAPRLRPTRPNAQVLALIQCMQSWNVATKSSLCCRWHAAAQSLQKHANNLAGGRCYRDFAPQGNAQCGRCGTLFVCAEGQDPVSRRRCYICSTDTVVSIQQSISL